MGCFCSQWRAASKKAKKNKTLTKTVLYYCCRPSRGGQSECLCKPNCSPNETKGPECGRNGSRISLNIM